VGGPRAAGRVGAARPGDVDVPRRAVRDAEERAAAAGGGRGRRAVGGLAAAGRAGGAAGAAVDEVGLAGGAMLAAVDGLVGVGWLGPSSCDVAGVVLAAKSRVERADAAATLDAEERGHGLRVLVVMESVPAWAAVECGPGPATFGFVGGHLWSFEKGVWRNAVHDRLAAADMAAPPKIKGVADGTYMNRHDGH
jgi:hypothetical protein